jgi:para-nitrobenzyl esterase
MNTPRVVTVHGTVQGTAHEGFERFLGIPYAAPPVGVNRFRPAAPPLPFDGVFHATSFAPHAPQNEGITEQFLSEGVPITMSERDCLALNVWTPRCDEARRPVLFWLHGGAFLTGSSSSSIYSGASFAARHDVVVVSCNYRLGVLGFANVAGLGGDEFVGSGSLGVQDAAAGLRWVRDHVSMFGGDPDNVTVFGESAGAMAVATLLALPGASGLFHKAILQSGAASAVASVGASEEHFAELFELLGSPSSIEELQSLPVEDLLRAQQTVVDAHLRAGPVFRPVVDGRVLDVPPLEGVRDGRAAGVPLLIGTNLDEWRLFSSFDPELQTLDEVTLAKAVAPWFHGDPGVAIATYRKRLGEAPAKLVFDCFGTDSVFRIPAIRLAEAHSSAGGETSMYLFSWRTPVFGGGLGSFHGLELPFVFNALGTTSGGLMTGEAAPHALADSMHATWAKFARTGDLGAGPLGPWPRYEPGTRTTMVLDEVSRLEDDPLRAERLLWEH